MLQYHFSLDLDMYGDEVLVIFASNQNQAWRKCVQWLRANKSNPERYIKYLMRAENAPEIKAEHEAIHFEWWE